MKESYLMRSNIMSGYEKNQMEDYQASKAQPVRD
jgi:hypothetical protein